jgi:hypothetical protein
MYWIMKTMPRIILYLSFLSGVLTFPLGFVIANFSDLFRLGQAFLVVSSVSTFLAGLVMIWAAVSFASEPEGDSRSQGVLFAMSGVAGTMVFWSGIWQVSLWFLSGPFFGFVASMSFFVGKRVSFFW